MRSICSGRRQSSSESLDSSVTCLRRRGKYYEFSDFEADLKSQVVELCVLFKVREKVFMESTIILTDLLISAWCVEATMLSVVAMTASSTFSQPEHVD